MHESVNFNLIPVPLKLVIEKFKKVVIEKVKKLVIEKYLKMFGVTSTLG